MTKVLSQTTIDLLLEVKRQITQQPKYEGVGFHMARYVSFSLPDTSGRHCGTVACIGGHLAMNITGGFDSFEGYSSGYEWVRHVLSEGLEDFHEFDDEFMTLFNMGDDPVGYSYDEITPAMAARAISRFIETNGTDSWDWLSEKEDD